MKRKLLFVVAFLLVAGALAYFFVLPSVVERRYNGVSQRPPYAASERARALHKTLTVADLHADSLLWDRSILERADRGHVDLPRLVEGGVALQVFSVVTKVPYGSNYERNDDSKDLITLVAIAERWPVGAWTSTKARALYQARKLNDAVANSNGRLVFIKTSGDLARFLERRKSEPQLVAALLSLEGSHALETDASNVEAFYDAGFRMLAPAHFFDNEWGGSAHGINKIGLTGKGRELVRAMEARGMIVDLAHASAKTIEDVLKVSTRAVVVSHTGVRGVCDNQRNLTDEQLRGVAATGGVVGIGYWESATCGTDAAAVARSIRYAANIVGADHVALGSDFDGTVAVPFDTTGVVEVTDALLAEGFSDDEIRMIMGGNFIRVLSETLPR